MVAGAYFLVGIAVRVYVSYSCSKSRRAGDAGASTRHENGRQVLDLLLLVGGSHPLLFVIEIALWPLWLLFLWAYQPGEDDDETI